MEGGEKEIKFNHITVDLDKYNLDFSYNLKDALGNTYIVIANEEGEFGLKGPDGKFYYIDENGDLKPAPADYERRFSTYSTDITVPIDLTDEIGEMITDILNNLNGSIDDINGQLLDLLNELSSLSDINDQINDAIDDAKEDIKAQLADYVTRIYNKLNDIFSKTPNKALQPILIAKDGSKVQTLARSRKQATKVKSTTLTLIPTSYTMELFAPAYKKYIVVSNVWDKSGHWADASIGRAANGKNMGVIIDNATQTVKMNGKKGYTYEISYNAVDYQGKIVNKKFYVRF